MREYGSTRVKTMAEAERIKKEKEYNDVYTANYDSYPKERMYFVYWVSNKDYKTTKAKEKSLRGVK